MGKYVSFSEKRPFVMTVVSSESSEGKCDRFKRVCSSTKKRKILKTCIVNQREPTGQNYTWWTFLAWFAKFPTQK